jgi:hypothetical protein
MKNSLSLIAGFGLITLSLATASAQGLKLNLAWTLAPGDRYYFTTGSNQRGMAYNPVTSHLILVNRQSSFVTVNTIDALTGNDIGIMDVSSLTNGGTMTLNQVRVADDGVVYGANFGTVNASMPQFTIYRWSDESSPSVIAYASDPGSGNSQQWGYTLAVRGAGTNTQILLSSSAGTIAALLTTADGTNFTSRVLATDLVGGQMQSAVAFGTNNTFWTKSVGGPLVHLSFNANAGTATTLHYFSTTNFPGSVGPFNVDLADNLLAGIDFRSPEYLDLYAISNLTTGPVLLDDVAIPYTYSNGGQNGAVAFGGGMVFVLDTNNGLQGYNMVPSSDPVAPMMVLQPVPTTVFVGSTAAMVASAAGTAPLSYQWFTNGVAALNATNPVFSITNISMAYDADYSLIVSNIAGTVPSATAHLTVLPAGVMTPLWSLPAGSRTYLATSGTVQRSIAFNPVSKHVMVVTRNTPPIINVLDGATDADIGPMSVAGISGGTFPLMMVGVADDGAIYGANWGTPSVSVPTKVYRWASEAAAPTVAYQGDPANGTNYMAYGAAISVRGAGTNTQILLPAAPPTAPSGYAIVFTTKDGTNFTPTLLSGVVTNTVYEGATFGMGNTFWGKANLGYASPTAYGPLASTLVYYSFDLPSATATLIASYDSTSQFDQSIAPIGVDPVHSLMGGVAILSSVQHTFHLYDISQVSPTAGPVFLQKVNAPKTPSNANTLYRGAVAFGNGMYFAFDSNNGLSAFVLPLVNINPKTGAVTVSWASTLTGFKLQSAPNVTSGNWSAVSGAVLTNGQYNVTLPASAPAQLFRLIK